jgi:hypothetical protein
MARKNQSGKSLLIKSGLRYLWEEMKTMNVAKFRSLRRLLWSYFMFKRDQRRRALPEN